MPTVNLVGLLVNPNFADALTQLRDVEDAAQSLGLKLAVQKAGTEIEIDTAFAESCSPEDWRDPRDRRSILHEPTPSDRRAGSKVCDACDVRITRLGDRRRPDELRTGPRKWISPRRRLRGQSS